MVSVSLLEFKEGWSHTETVLTPFPMGKFRMALHSDDGNAHFQNKKLKLKYKTAPGKRGILCHFKDFYQGKDLHVKLKLRQPEMDTMCIATLWREKPTAFYYNQKINCMRASGTVVYGDKTYHFDPDTDFGTLDWGRGVWTYDNTWYWGSGNGIVEGKPFGFNLGYGFSDRSSASENILFYDGVAHKLDDVTFHIPADSYTSPWRISSSDGRFEADFLPILDRAAKLDVKVICSDQHQVFGRMNGRATLDDGRVLQIKDLLCFAEKVHNRY